MKRKVFYILKITRVYFYAYFYHMLTKSKNNGIKNAWSKEYLEKKSRKNVSWYFGSIVVVSVLYLIILITLTFVPIRSTLILLIFFAIIFSIYMLIMSILSKFCFQKPFWGKVYKYRRYSKYKNFHIWKNFYTWIPIILVLLIELPIIFNLN